MMNAAEWHLAINHLPVAGTIFGFFTLLVAMIIRSESATKTGLIFLIASGIFCIPAVISGENAHEMLEHLDFAEGMHDFIHEHEEMAESARWISLIVAVLAIIGLYFTFTKRAFAKLFNVLTLLGSLASMIYLAQVAHSGGEIRHTEIRQDFSVPENSD